MDNVQKTNTFPSIAGKYNKHYKLVEQCFDCIDKMNTQIQRIQADTSLSTMEKQRKIMQRQDNINRSINEIENTRCYLQEHGAWTSAMQARFEKVR
jgi:TolA-binding protein